MNNILEKKIVLDCGKEIYIEINMSNDSGELIITIPNEDGTTVIEKIPFSAEK